MVESDPNVPDDMAFSIGMDPRRRAPQPTITRVGDMRRVARTSWRDRDPRLRLPSSPVANRGADAIRMTGPRRDANPRLEEVFVRWSRSVSCAGIALQSARRLVVFATVRRPGHHEIQMGRVPVDARNAATGTVERSESHEVIEIELANSGGGADSRADAVTVHAVSLRREKPR